MQRTLHSILALLLVAMILERVPAHPAFGAAADA